MGRAKGVEEATTVADPLVEFPDWMPGGKAISGKLKVGDEILFLCLWYGAMPSCARLLQDGKGRAKLILAAGEIAKIDKAKSLPITVDIDGATLDIHPVQIRARREALSEENLIGALADQLGVTGNPDQ